jgi:hypothetical protein
MNMNVLAPKDAEEIKARIESRDCPFCGKRCSISLSLNNDRLIYGTKTLCCDKRKESFTSELNDEYQKQISIKASRFLY